MRADGPDLDAVDRALRRPEVRCFYTIPTFHNPLGTTTALAHRRELLAIAERTGKPLVEDAYEMDLRFAGRPVPPLAGLDESGLVVQLVSFSKSLFPGLRAGALVARGRAVEALLALKHATDLGGALPLQAALADFVRSGAYDRHLAGLRRRLRSRRDALLEALAAEMPSGVALDHARRRLPGVGRAPRAPRLARRLRRGGARRRARRARATSSITTAAPRGACASPSPRPTRPRSAAAWRSSPAWCARASRPRAAAPSAPRSTSERQRL